MPGTLPMPWLQGHWLPVLRTEPMARALADAHYSRQTPGAAEFMSSGRTLVMVTSDARAVWGAIENMDPAGALRWRVAIFRRERDCEAPRASDLVREATDRTFTYWRQHYGAIPAVPLETEVDPAAVRHKRDPGRCFLRAGWRVVDRRRGLVVLRAPTVPA